MHLILLPGMDGTGRLFGPLLRILPPGLEAAVVAYPADRPCGYAELLPLVEAAVPDGGEFLILGESFSGPLASLLAARRPRRLRGVILCASFARSPLPSFISRLRRIAWYPEGARLTSGAFSRESKRWPWWVRTCSSKLRRRWRPA
jgi:pimeloyl-ACP methyl ester carboxylesterase